MGIAESVRYLSGGLMKPTQEGFVDQRSLNVKTTKIRDVEIEFMEWVHPQIGVVPVDPKTPLILKVKIREEV